MSAVNSTCSDLREINEAKVSNILAYLDDVHTVGGGFGVGMGMAGYAGSPASSMHYQQQQQQQHTYSPAMYQQHQQQPPHQMQWGAEPMGGGRATPLPQMGGAYQQQQQQQQHHHYNPNAYLEAIAGSEAEGASSSHAAAGSTQRPLLSQQNLKAHSAAASSSHSSSGGGGGGSPSPQQQQQQQQRSSASATEGASPAPSAPSPSAHPKRAADGASPQSYSQSNHGLSPSPTGTASVAPLRRSPSVGGGGTGFSHQQRMMMGGFAPTAPSCRSVASTTAISASVVSASVSAALLMPSSDPSSQVYNGIKRRIDELKSANEALVADKARLERQLAEFEGREGQRVAKLKQIATSEVEGMRAEQQRLVSQHAAAMAKMVREKEALVVKCDELAAAARLLKESKALEAARAADQHAAAISELKGKWLLQEKQRREQWMVAESKRVKENTLKAMEPDIALLMGRHKAERARIQEECDLIVKRKEQQTAEREQQLQEARLQMGRDLEAMVLKEREQFRQRGEEEAERYQKVAEEARRQHEAKVASLNAFFEEQKQHYLGTIKGLEAELLAARGQAAEREATFRAAVAAEVKTAVAAKEAELAAKEAGLDEELDRLRAGVAKEGEEAMRRREEEYKSIMRQERDAAIAKVVQKLEDEHVRQLSSNKEASSLSKERTAQLAREVERLTLEKQVLEQRAQTLVGQGKAANDLVETLQAELQTMRDERKAAAEAADDAFGQRMAALDRMWQQKLTRFEAQHVEEVQQLQHSGAMALRAHGRRVEELEAEARGLEAKHNAELSTINDRVVAAMAKREATVHMLQEQLRLAQAMVHEREAELERHRMLLDS